MDVQDWSFWGNALQQWAIAAAVAVGLMVVLQVAKSWIVARLVKLAERTENRWDDVAAAVLGRTRLFFLFFLGLGAGAQFLDLPENAAELLGEAVVLAFLLQVGIWGNAAIQHLFSQYTTKRLAEDAAEATTVRFLGFLARLGFWAIVLLLAMTNLGIEIGPLLAGLGVGGIAVALAVQNVLGDLFASLSIVLDKPFVIGDFIIVGDMMGTVEHIGLKTTRLRSLGGEQLVFSNSDLLSSRVRNYKRMFERRIVFGFGVLYQTPRERVARIPDMVREAVEAQEDVRFDRAHLKAFGDSSLDFEAVYYVLLPDYNVYMDRQQAINLELMRRFEEEGVEFAYPTRTIYIEGGDAPATQ